MAVERTHLSIGEVLTLLQPEYPDITISKIRFLESQGLLDPERTPSGYRKFHDPDIERLRWILTQQRDHFLPLKVIKDRLNSGDLTGDGDGVLPLGGDTPSRPTASSTGPNRSRANRDADVDAGTSDDGDPAAFDGGAAQGAGDDRDDHGDATEVDGSTAARADDDSTAPPSTASEPAEGPDASGAETTPTTGSDARREAGATPEPSVAGSEQGNGVDGDPASADGGEEPGPGDGDVAPSEAEQASSRRALTLLKRAGVVPPDATAAASSHDRNDPDDHDRARNVARLVEAPAEASPDPATRGRRRHPTGHTPGEPVPPPEPDETDRPEPLEPASSVSLSLEELSTASGLSPRELGELERYGLLSNRTLGTVRYYDDEALVVARLAAGFGRYGIEPRHLRMYKVAAEREAGLFEQLITPLLKQRRASARQEAVEVLEELAELADDLRAAMVRSALRDYLGRS